MQSYMFCVFEFKKPVPVGQFISIKSNEIKFIDLAHFKTTWVDKSAAKVRQQQQCVQKERQDKDFHAVNQNEMA